MLSNNIIKIDRYRSGEESKKTGQFSNKTKQKKQPRKKGSVYNRGNKLWVSFHYLGEKVRERTGLDDTPLNRKQVRKQLDLIIAEMDNGIFEFAKRFPHSRRKDHFTELEGRQVTKSPCDVIFSDYVEKWWRDMEPGMSISKIRDYQSALKAHLLPQFAQMPLSGFNKVQMKKFIALMKSKTNAQGKPLSGRRIQNVMIPLRIIVRDAIDEYGWVDFADPFANLKVPKAHKPRVYPFSFDEWQTLMKHVCDWYRPYFEFAVQTGLRPSEQVALKWSAIDDRFIHIELSRVRNVEKEDLKTEESRRMIEIRPSIKKVLEKQWELTRDFESPYVFITPIGTPIIQDRLREQWARAVKESGLRYRRMYETRHTFASWALGAGELPEWVARTLGHVDTSMVYRTYGRYIPNLTRRDGSAFEALL